MISGHHVARRSVLAIKSTKGSCISPVTVKPAAKTFFRDRIDSSAAADRMPTLDDAGAATRTGFCGRFKASRRPCTTKRHRHTKAANLLSLRRTRAVQLVYGTVERKLRIKV